jgi:molybdopterin synthase catalytic subunit
MVRVGIGPEAPDIQSLTSRLASREDGALLLFLGVVRDHNDGRAVRGLEYEAYAEMAEEVLEEIGLEAQERSGSDRIFIHHRVGVLEVGEISTVIAVATPHRVAAYEASRYIIEEIKKRLPVWKKERYVEGDAEWVKGHIPRVEATQGQDGNGESGKGGE